MELAQSSITKPSLGLIQQLFWHVNEAKESIGHFKIHFSLYFKGSAKSFLPIPAFIHIEIRPNYHNKNFTPRLALKKRLGTTRKWSNPLYSIDSSVCSTVTTSVMNNPLRMKPGILLHVRPSFLQWTSSLRV